MRARALQDWNQKAQARSTSFTLKKHVFMRRHPMKWTFEHALAAIVVVVASSTSISTAAVASSSSSSSLSSSSSFFPPKASSGSARLSYLMTEAEKLRDSKRREDDSYEEAIGDGTDVLDTLRRGNAEEDDWDGKDEVLVNRELDHDDEGVDVGVDESVDEDGVNVVTGLEDILSSLGLRMKNENSSEEAKVEHLMALETRMKGSEGGEKREENEEREEGKEGTENREEKVRKKVMEKEEEKETEKHIAETAQRMETSAAVGDIARVEAEIDSLGAGDAKEPQKSIAGFNASQVLATFQNQSDCNQSCAFVCQSLKDKGSILGPKCEHRCVFLCKVVQGMPVKEAEKQIENEFGIWKELTVVSLVKKDVGVVGPTVMTSTTTMTTTTTKTTLKVKEKEPPRRKSRIRREQRKFKIRKRRQRRRMRRFYLKTKP